MVRIAFLLVLAGSPVAYSQEKPAHLTFEVISIKPVQPDPAHFVAGIEPLPGGQEYRTQAEPVKVMISLMYRIPMRQIAGGPDWLNTDRWDVDAKARSRLPEAGELT